MEITQIGLLAVKAESPYGTDSAPTAANVIPTVGDSITYTVNSTAEDRKSNDGTLDRLPGFNTKTHIKLVFRYELRNVGTPPEIQPLLLAANMSMVNHGGPFYYFQPALFTTFGPSVTCYWWSGLKLHKLIGGKVDCKITMEAGKMAIAEFTVWGKYSAVADVALPGGVTFITVKPPLVDGASISINGYAPVLSMLEFNLGNVIVPRPSANDADSIAGFVITGYDPKGTMDPESVTEADHDFWSRWKSSTLDSLSASMGSPGNRIFLGISVMETKKLTYSNAQNIRVITAEFNLPKFDVSQPSGSSFSLSII